MRKTVDFFSPSAFSPLLFSLPAAAPNFLGRASSIFLERYPLFSQKGIVNLLLRGVFLKLNLNFIKSKLDLYKFKFNFCKFKLDFIKLNFSFKKEYGFLAHIEQKVDDGEVGQEAMFLLKNLIIGLGNEVGSGGDAGVLFGFSQVGLEVQQFAALGNEGFVKVHEERPAAFVRGRKSS